MTDGRWSYLYLAAAAADALTFPSPADALYLVGYVVLIGAVLLATVRSRSPSTGTDILDALLVSLGIGTPVWLLWIAPAWDDTSGGRTGQLVGVSYGLVVLALGTALAWRLLATPPRTVGERFQVGAIAILAVTNLAYAIATYRGEYFPGTPIDLGWLATFALLGAGALHPSTGTERAPPRLAARRYGLRGLLVWALASVPPATLLVHVATGGRDGRVLLVTAAATFSGLALFALRSRTSTRLAEQLARAEENARFEALVEHIDDVVIVHAPDGAVRYLSTAAGRRWGLPPTEDVIGAAVHPDDRTRYRDELAHLAVARSGATRRFQVRILRGDGEQRHVEVTAVHQLDHPQLRGLVATGHDVTDRERHREELAAHAEAEQRVADQLRRVEQMKDTFLTAVSHDIRTPLTAIRGMAELLEMRGEELTTTTKDDVIRRLARNAEALETLVLDLLDLDRFTRLGAEPERVRVRLDHHVQTLLTREPYRREAITVTGEPAEAWVDAVMLERIVENLVGNAVKHTPPRTPVWVRLDAADDGGARLTVEDAGDGIPAAQREEMVRPFVRGDQSRSTPGHGVGLTLSATFARLHGGSLRIADRPGGGARIVVELPGRCATPPTSGNVAAAHIPMAHAPAGPRGRA